MNDDAELLRRYAQTGEQAAFTALVQRHLNLVYGAALRRTSGDRQSAADVAQQVFTRLALQARQLAGHTMLSAWLHTATRNAALNLMISEQRRRERERAANALDEAAAPATDAAWDQLRPVLDGAIDELAEPDRAIVVLRFLEQRSFAQIGATLRVSEDAARMRTERAIDKLRALLARRGITSTAAALATVIASQPLAAAPAGLATTLAHAALATAGTAAAGVGVVAGITAFLAPLMTTKIITTALVTAVAAFAGGSYFGIQHATQAPLPTAPTLPEHSQTIAALRKDVSSLRGEVDKLSAANSKLTGDLTAARAAAVAPVVTKIQPPPPTGNADLGQQQRMVLNNLRQLSAALEQFQLENKRPPTSLDEIVGERKYIRRLIPVAGEDYSVLPLIPGQPMSVVLPNGGPVTYDRNGKSTTVPAAPVISPEVTEARRRLGPAVEKAVAAWKAANPEKGDPKKPEDILPYFATPQEGADFVEALELEKRSR